MSCAVPSVGEMAPPTMDDIGLTDFDRSNKGASKQRRDQINAEIATMRDLLPLPESSRQRLSQLQIMSLTCVYIRKCNVLQKLFHKSQDTKSKQSSDLPDSLDFFQALTGFLLVTTKEGKLLYISENVTDFLGHSMVDMKTQGDSLYDIVDKRDQAAVQAQLMAGGGEEPRDVSFFCRMNMSRTLKRQSGFGDVKIMHVRGHLSRVTDPSSPVDGQHVLLATCSPLITSDLKENLVQNNTMVFKTVHRLDMSYLEVSNIAEHHLGYTSEELSKQSWYSMIHPEDIQEAKEKHVQLIRSNHEMGSMMTVRMLTAEGNSFWVNIVMHVRQAAMTVNDEPLIVCINQVINAQEAYQIKVQNHMFSMYPSRAHEMWSTQLSAVTSGQEVSSHSRWMQQGYQPPMTPQPMYQLQCPPGMAVAQGSKVIGLSPSSYNASAIMQSDKLKAMLKRKIQGPQVGQCRPTKISKMSWMDECGGRGYGDAGQGMSMIEGYSHVQMPLSIDTQGQTLQVVQTNSFRGDVPLIARSTEVLNCQGIPVPVLSKCSMISEQVVPDVNVPESYLTPEPSPVNSPQPSSGIKTEKMESDIKMQMTNFSCHLQALEKLAALSQDSSATKSQGLPSLRSLVPTKVVKTPRFETSVKSNTRRRNLPELDAFDIDTFFDLLEPKVFEKVERQIKTEIKTEIDEDIAKTDSVHQNCPQIVVKEETNSESDFQVSSPKQDCFRNTEDRLERAQPFPEQVAKLNSEHEKLTSHQDEASHLSSPPQSLCGSSSPSHIPIPSPKNMSPCSAASSPYSAASEGGFDLLSCFSDDGLDLSPLQMAPRSMMLDSSVSDEFEDHSDSSSFLKSFYSESEIFGSNDLKQRSSELPEELSPHLSEEMSPRSVSSLLASEEENMGSNAEFTIAQALKDLGSDNDSCATSLKDRDVLGDELQELDLLLGAY